MISGEWDGFQSSSLNLEPRLRGHSSSCDHPLTKEPVDSGWESIAINGKTTSLSFAIAFKDLYLSKELTSEIPKQTLQEIPRQTAVRGTTLSFAFFRINIKI